MTLLLTVAALAMTGSALVVAAGTAVRVGRGPGPYRPDRRELSAAVRETVAQLLLVLLMPARRWAPPNPPRQAGGRPPVLLVPGYGWTAGTLLPLAWYLQRRGWRGAWPIDNRPRRGRVPDLAAHLAERIEAACAATGSDRVDIVAHSMGGVVAAWACQHLGAAPRVRRLVTLGSPWEGTPNAVFGRLPAARDLEPDAEVIRRLGPPPIHTTPITGGFDHVVPPELAAPPGVQPLAIPHLGHNEMLLSPRVFRAVARALGAP